MIIRCDDLYRGRWCPVCGTCQCRSFVGKEMGSSLTWADAGTNALCSMHGNGSRHGHRKILTAQQESRIEALIRRRVQETLRTS